MQFLKSISHSSIYFTLLLLMAVGLPSSHFLMSISGIGLAVVFLATGNLKEKFSTAFSSKPVLMLLSLYFLHLIGLLYTSDLNYAINDLKVKLPLLYMPLIFMAMPVIQKKHFHQLLRVFILSCLATSLIGIINFYSEQDPTLLLEERKLSPFISHIRFSLLLCLAIFFAAFDIKRSLKNWYWIPIIFWFIIFLYLMGSVTGAIILVASLFLYSLLIIITSSSTFTRSIAAIMLVFVGASGYFFVISRINNHYEVADIDVDNLPEKTKFGNLYEHDTAVKHTENGHYVWINVAEEEMKEAWNERSDIHYDSLDQRDQVLKYTLIRYLTSLGLRKDREGVYTLSQADIHNVERGVATIKELKTSGLTKRVDQIIFEVDNYVNGGNPSGNSVTQRLEFWKAGWRIVLDNFLFGVGTGDIEQAYHQQYEKMNTQLYQEFRHRTHNQFLTFFVTFGVIGFIIFLAVLFLPGYYLSKYRDPYYLSFFIVAILSFLSEDTLETQAGVTFFAFFNCLLLFRNYDLRALKRQ